MARARKIVGDLNSAELDHLKRTVNTLILMLETAGTSVDDGATAEEILSAWSAGIAAGVDNNPESTANITSTGRTIEGLWTTPKHPDRPKMPQLVDMNSDSDF
jgi:hypothetical protein